jgi:transcription elongation GreA/GreB family factor
MTNERVLPYRNSEWLQSKLELDAPDFTGEVIWVSPEGANIIENEIQKAESEKDKLGREYANLPYRGHDQEDDNTAIDLQYRINYVITRTIDELKRKRSNCVPFQQAKWFKNSSFDTITLGTRITLHASDSDEQEVYDLLGPIESSYGTHETQPISYESPLGKTLFGKSKDDIINLDSGLTFKILEIKQIILP